MSGDKEAIENPPIDLVLPLEVQKVFESTSFWFNSSSESKTKITPEQERARNEILTKVGELTTPCPISVPRTMFDDSSPEVDKAFELLRDYVCAGEHKEELFESLMKILRTLECRHVNIAMLDCAQPTAYTKFREMMYDLVDARTGNDKNVVDLASGTLNGYEVRQYKGVPYDLKFGKEWAKLWNEACSGDMLFAEFEKETDEEMCSDWAKMDQYGDCYGGYWKSEDQAVKAKAYILSRYTNIWHLYQLPFPKRLLIASVSLGCSRRRESVEESNFYLVLFQKYAEIAGLELREYQQPIDPRMPTLEDQVRLTCGDELSTGPPTTVGVEL